ncbi:hypothetical protein [Paraburkholderia sp. BL21I4N1]|uniref:hypothetical protein n=1 Tax=Paraburkholderia sp. BL21I4N1 TaxID=1938801 RepID=UPI000CFD1659|nr:hypothetical protein [Paraburkholderia sp. BL21I4N1]PQV46071.1 hypothetical protein B0G83_11430 [Paraburkholderia sp. BL21I4N1]
MLITTMLLRRLVARLTGARGETAQRGAPGDPQAGSDAVSSRRLRWRMPWLAWQTLSWVSLTLLAPPFWAIGALQVINPHSDQPFFWNALMAIVPLAGGVTIVLTNQQHYRAPFRSHRAAALYYFQRSMALTCVLVMLLLWGTHAIDDLIAPLAIVTPGSHPAALALWMTGLVAAFGISSSLHASILHVWLAFLA